MWKSIAAEANDRHPKRIYKTLAFWIVPTYTMTTLEILYAELADIERQQQDKTLPHSDQQLLDQAWEETTNQIDDLERSIEDCEEEGWRDAREVIGEVAPSFPSYPLTITIPSPHISPSYVPPPPRPDPYPVCNCDGDGRCDYCLELEAWNALQDDRDEGCKHCSGCAYCIENGGYDGANEV